MPLAVGGPDAATPCRRAEWGRLSALIRRISVASGLLRSGLTGRSSSAPLDTSMERWSLGNGHVDDLVGTRHGLGQPFAWDFGYNNAADPGGTTWGKIYAARAGTVIDLRDGVTAEVDGVARRMALM